APSPLVVRVRVTPVSVLSTTTVVLGTAAPAASVMVPLILPLPEVWARIGRPAKTRKVATTANRDKRLKAIESFMRYCLLKDTDDKKRGVNGDVAMVLNSACVVRQRRSRRP